MGFTLYACVVATAVFVYGHMGGSSDLMDLSPQVRNRFIGEVLVRIAKQQNITTDTRLDDITFDVNTVTRVAFTRLHILDTDVETTRIVGDYEIDSNDVLENFPRSGRLNVTFHELLKEVGVVSLVSSRQIPTTRLQNNHSANLNALVDFILMVVKDKIRENGQDQIEIPDVDKNFTTDIAFFPVRGRFRAQGGWFRNLSAVQRTGDTVATVVGNTISVVCSFGLQTMEFGFNQFEANLGFTEASGALSGTIPCNSISAKISLTYINERCRATLDSLKVTQLSGIEVHISNQGGFSWLLSFLANYATDSNKEKIVSAVEQHLSKNIEDLLSHFHCEKYFKQVYNQHL